MIRNFVLMVIVIALGWLGSFYYRRYEVNRIQQQMHAQIAAIRTYEEGYALRHGHYVLLPDSCKTAPVAGWKEIGMAPPTSVKGCFWTEPLLGGPPADVTDSASPATSVSIQIVGVSPDRKITGRESSEGKQPTWNTSDGSKP